MLTYKCPNWMNKAAVVAAVNQAAVSRIKQAAHVIEREAKRSMVGGHGIASEPGTPPHRQSSILAGSIDVQGPTSRGTYLVGPKAPYGKHHEFGDPDHNLPKRPFMAPALLKSAAAFPALFRNMPLGSTPAGSALNTGRPPV